MKIRVSTILNRKRSNRLPYFGCSVDFYMTNLRDNFSAKQPKKDTRKKSSYRKYNFQN